MFRYLSSNTAVIKSYDDLIFNLFNGGNKNLIYDEKTNLYTKKNIRNKKLKK
jgi:hypothetical protein